MRLPHQPESQYFWIVGVLLAGLGAFVSNLGLNLQKLQHVYLSQKSEEEKKLFYTFNLWRIGLVLTIIGSLADVAALVFAPQSLIAPLGSLTLVSNSIFAPLLLEETITTRDLVATSTIIAGSVIAVISGSHQDVIYSLHQLFDFYTEGPFLVFGSLVLIYITLLYCAIKHMDAEEELDCESPKYLRMRGFHRFAYASIAGTVGAQNILFAKCSVELVANAATNHAFIFEYYQTYLVLGCLLSTIFFQIRWLNQGLAKYDASYIVPVFTAFWVLLSVASGLVFYREWVGMTYSQMGFFSFGVLVTISGVVALSHREFSDDATAPQRQKPGRSCWGGAAAEKKKQQQEQEEREERDDSQGDYSSDGSQVWREGRGGGGQPPVRRQQRGHQIPVREHLYAGSRAREGDHERRPLLSRRFS